MTWGVWTMIHSTKERGNNMTATRLKIVLSFLLAFAVAACSTTELNINYKKLDSELPLSADPALGRKIGYVTGEAGGYVWSRCVPRAEMSLNELVENAQAAGADGVAEVRWDSTGSPAPGCQRKWL